MINQLLPTISYGDAVSNSAVNMMRVLRNMGIKSQIYAQNIHPRMTNYAHSYIECPKDEPIIYHMSTGSELAYEFTKYKSRRIMLYHNITPEQYFIGYSGSNQILCKEGREQLNFLSSITDFALADSEYNKIELDLLGYKKTYVTPIMINYEDYDKKPDQSLLKELKKNNTTNILFVGRIAPNKKQEDVIKTFYYYKKHMNNNSKLYLVGSYQGMERYYEELLRLINHLELDLNVIITGHIPFDQILAYYAGAHLFLCMSEHEGFCVPLVEAMYFRLPIVAFKSSAIDETLGNGGILTLDKDYVAIAGLINIILKDSNLKARLIENQQYRLNYYSRSNTETIFKEMINKILKGE